MENLMDLNKIIGLVPMAIEQSVEEILFRFECGSVCKFYHEQDCCEDVYVEDVNGEWDDLIGVPLLVADERTSESENEWAHQTWTFYTFRSIKGSVDVRWFGQSNGYYSERVDFKFNPAK
jgi:hypothetical protein